jgi:hypothetical protein
MLSARARFSSPRAACAAGRRRDQHDQPVRARGREHVGADRVPGGIEDVLRRRVVGGGEDEDVAALGRAERARPLAHGVAAADDRHADAVEERRPQNPFSRQASRRAA